LDKRLPAADSEPTRLHAAMRDSVLNGGNRVRPLLLFCTARAVGLGEAQVEAAACAIELMHAYSRVHDHLPAMDDEDLRRGKPTCHQAYDEGTAVLVGDALQSLAFQVLAGDEALPRPPRIRLRLIELLADAIGAGGKAGGQSLEAAMQERQPAAADIETLYARKTGALIRASVLMAVACAPHTAPDLQVALGDFASSAGVAFQIQDDLLDLSGGGKRAHDKLTYPAAVGLAAAQRRVEALYAQALEALRPLGPGAEALRSLTGWLLVHRKI
jgi:farnesyl diphosphate synthase